MNKTGETIVQLYARRPLKKWPLEKEPGHFLYR
jgi:hypothetical protein